MKISLKLQENNHQNHHHKPHQQPPLLLRAKIPISIFNLPFLSHFSTTTTHPSDLSLSLSTNFPSFPSLKLSYAAAASPAAAPPPLTLTLKSGTGLFGSPNNSPLVISAHFSFNPSNPSHPNPTFSLFLKPQLGSFSLRKSTCSHPEPEPTITSEPTNPDDSNSFAFVPLETPVAAKEESNLKGSVFKGAQLAATTQMPVGKRVALNFRWWVNLTEDQMPVLRINKIGIHRVDDAVKDDAKSKNEEAKSGELDSLKSMCFWMKREVDVLTRVNREMKSELEEMRRAPPPPPRSSASYGGGGNVKEGVRTKAMPSVGSPSSATKQRKNGRGEENGNGNAKKEVKKNGNLAIDVENELQRAIMAAAAAGGASS